MASEEFNFWGVGQSQYYESITDEDGSEREFGGNFEQEFDDFSVGLWKTNTSRNVRNETSRLLPVNHPHSNISPKPESKAMAEARKELMEKINDMPESSYELSLKDIVDEKEQLALQRENEEKEKAIEGTGFDLNTSETQIKKQSKKNIKNIAKSDRISRTGSMGKESFLIKMFIPSTFSWKKKTSENDPKAFRKPSFHVQESHVDEEWGIKRFLSAGDRKRSNTSSTSRSSSSSSTNSSRCTSSSSSKSSRSFSPGCWPFFCTRKSKHMRDRGRGCFF
ncbi:hypothetical protein JCGZ_03717 [Jatropha curcas]|uniref:Uncharacterized protein n=1 Tax=Jatropha curcas TaxID=180498 RepID=A0A067L4K8_JATCU|nr:vitellogenin-A2 [Jatropha curcas]KDP39435.1 hypothetical protein JCGZ_03717 [Jatropha curcas]